VLDDSIAAINLRDISAMADNSIGSRNAQHGELRQAFSQLPWETAI
jgi:hypothetical protein